MRITNKLCAQHLDWVFKKHWLVQGKRVARDTGAKAELESRGISVVDPKDVIFPKRPHEKLDFVGWKPKQLVEDETHPLWKNEICHVLGNNNVLLEGILQGQVLLKTIVIDGLPKNLEDSFHKTRIPAACDKNVQNAILISHLLDAEQKKTAIIKIPERPAVVLPRTYGITHSRKNTILLSKLVFECEKLAGRSLNSQRKIINNANFIASVIKENDKIQFNFTAETFITSKKPIEPVKTKYEAQIPDLFPVKCTITIPKTNIYNWQNFYPLRNQLDFSNPHTILLHYSPLDVKNLQETPVTDEQFQARTLLKAFGVSTARAKQLYGENVTTLPKPIVVQSVQTDGKRFHFGIFQLNTLNLDGNEGTKNFWFNMPNIELFTECLYKSGRPILGGYNKDIIKYMSIFYNNC